MTIREFLEDADHKAFADAVGVELRTVLSWRLGDRRPSPELAVVIERVTFGRVTFREAMLETKRGTA